MWHVLEFHAMPDRRLLAAIALSLLTHVLAVSSPAWRLPFESDEPEKASLLDVHLVSPPNPPPAPAIAHPKPHPKATKQSRPAITPPELLAETPTDIAVLVGADSATAEASAPSMPPVAVEPLPPPLRAPKREITWPRQGHIRFVVTRGEQGFILGVSVHSWEHDEAHYSIRTVTETTGLVSFFKRLKIVQVSVGTIGPAGLAPQEFHVERDGKLAEGARFDNEAQLVTLTDGGLKRRDDSLAEGAQDLLSHLYQFGLVEKQQRFELMIATGKKYASYAYELVGQETLATRFGDVPTLHYRTPPMPGEQTTEIWLAPDFRNLPVRIRFIDRSGDIYDQNADEIEMDGKMITSRGSS